MVISQLIQPKSIAVIGASDNTTKPGGMVLQNLINGKFEGKIFAVNPKPVSFEGVTYVSELNHLKAVDLAIIAIPASQCLETVRTLLKMGTKAFIVFSAGFSEAGERGIELEKELTDMVNKAGGTLIGPNCVGIISEKYKGVFTTPVPEYDPQGCELISSSGATAVFIMESALLTGLRFSNVYSIGNAAQTGVEEILEYLDVNFDEHKSPKVQLLYLEQVKKPFKFLKHTTSLIQKGCRIAAIKSGYSEAGGRAASSHTGALATADNVIRALFRKAGIVYCSSRDELIAVGSVFQSKELKGENIAIITHAGGSAVMLTDALTSNGLNVPQFDSDKAATLLSKLNPGSSVNNPIDFLATGTAKHLGEIIDFCEGYDVVDAMVVVFGSPGLFNVKDVYELLDKKMSACTKPIYPVLPSLINAEKEIKQFLSKRRVNFPDEVNLGKALAHVYTSTKYRFEKTTLPEMDIVSVRSIINTAQNGYLDAQTNQELLAAAGIAQAEQLIISDKSQFEKVNSKIKFPVAMKVIGPVHKTEVNGVMLNINSIEQALNAFEILMKIPDASAVLVQEMVKGEELYCGAVRQGDFGHVVLCGLGGVFLELLQDTASALAPMSYGEVKSMVESLKAYPLFKGYRNKKGLNEEKFIEIVMRIALVHIAPEISELDLNPIKADEHNMIVVDSRICIDKNGR
ncbi:MAG: acetate--CoA ligase family protein [Bacteroidota bacterium]|nr:MAG: acetate--CoA ligase family protein [Bacteroidota bacterium]